MNIEQKQAAIRLIGPEREWFDCCAIDDLQRASLLRGMDFVAGMPDMHAGKGYPIGAAMVSRDFVHPYLIGNDIGCGMALFQSNLKRSKIKRDRWANKLCDLEHPWTGDFENRVDQLGLVETEFDSQIGTIGGGNHFAELQQVHKVVDKDRFNAVELDSGKLYLLVHSGSRALGQSVFRQYVDRFRDTALSDVSAGLLGYMRQHDHATAWAKLNREIIAQRFLTQLNSQFSMVLDIAHNTINKMDCNGDTYWVHRKGAAAADQGLVMIPGSRGTLSYLVEPIVADITHGWSIAHGAGRKWNRHDTESRMRHRYRKEELIQTVLGSRVICEEKAMLYQEAPNAYKDIEVVIKALEDAALIKVIATFSPIITYKKRCVR